MDETAHPGEAVELEGLLARAVALHRAAHLEEAAGLYGRILDQVPEHARTLHLLGRIRLQQRQIAEAIELLSKAASLDPAAAHHAALGDAYQRAARFDQALKAYEAAAARAPGDATVAAKIDSLAFLAAQFDRAAALPYRADLLAFALDEAKLGGLVLEFGVAGGRSLALLAGRAGQPVYGFDSFEGLPEDWRPGFAAGAFRQPRLPADLPENAVLVPGRFEQTLAGFAAAHGGPVRFLHVDCDLYASTCTVFEHLGARLIAGSVVVFDEYLNYAGWREHEHRAFMEFARRAGQRFEFIGYVPGGMQVAVRMLGSQSR